MTAGAIWQLLIYLHAKAAVDADDTAAQHEMKFYSKESWLKSWW